MGLPKKKTDNRLTPPKFGNRAADELLHGSDEKTTFLPPSIGLEDVDATFMEMVTDGELAVTLDDATPPVFMMNNERWGEFAKTWTMTNGDKNITPPFVTVKRAKVGNGTLFGDKWAIGTKTFQYLKVPTFDDSAIGYDVYKIPQPTAVDVTYEIRFFTRYMVDVNVFIEHYLAKYRKRQLYLTVKGHYMPTVMDEEITEDGTVEDLNGDRYYVVVASVTVKAYLQDEREFQKVTAKNKVVVVTEVTGTGIGHTSVIKKN